MGELLIVWSVRLGLLCFVAALVLWERDRAATACRFAVTARWLWASGFALFVLHLIAAFHFHHHWDHEHAVAETARQTEEMVGFAFGGGLYFNYAFLALWLIDLAWLYWRGNDGTRRRVLQWAIIAYLLFIAFNGTVVFKTGWLRWLGLLATAVLCYTYAPRAFALWQASRARRRAFQTTRHMSGVNGTTEVNTRR